MGALGSMLFSSSLPLPSSLKTNNLSLESYSTHLLVCERRVLLAGLVGQGTEPLGGRQKGCEVGAGFLRGPAPLSVRMPSVTFGKWRKVCRAPGEHTRKSPFSDVSGQPGAGDVSYTFVFESESVEDWSSVKTR